MTTPPIDAADLTWLLRLALALVGERNRAEDLVQDTLVLALETDLPAGPARRPWLRAVARRVLAHRARGESRRRRREQGAARPEALPDTALLLERAEAAEALAGRVRGLAEPYRRTLLLHFLEGLEPARIAELEGRPVDTVRWRLRRGLELLREELERSSNGRDWRLALLPLCIAPPTRVLPALSTAGGALLSPGPLTWIAMKLALASLAAASLVVALVLLGPGRSGGSRSAPTGPADGSPTAAGPSIEARPEHAPLVETDATPDRRGADVAPPPGPAGGPDEARGEEVVLRVRVLDGASRQPVEGARVFLRGLEEGGEEARLLASARSDAAGRVELPWPGAAASLELGAVAEGYLRGTPDVPLVAGTPPEGEPVLLLERGREVQVRVRDELGAPVAGLALLAHVERAPVGHVSPSRVLLRADAAGLGSLASGYEEARGTTDGQGAVDLRGLPPRSVELRSLDPGWVLLDPTTVEAAEGVFQATARAVPGVRLEVVDEPEARISSNFRMELTLEDGEVADLGQYVGSGVGSASFALTEDLLPEDLRGRRIVAALFYGVAELAGGELAWRAPRLADPAGAGGVALVRLDPSRAVPAMVPEEERVPVVLDVRHVDGSVFPGEVAVWLRDETDTRSLEAERIEPGRHLVRVPPGRVRLEVADAKASGSLPPWSGTVDAGRSGPLEAAVTLPRGGELVVRRPAGWSGVWRVHLSWREDEADEWFGSWTYGTDGEELALTALRPATWRVTVHQRADERASGEEHVVRVLEGASTRVP